MREVGTEIDSAVTDPDVGLRWPGLSLRLLAVLLLTGAVVKLLDQAFIQLNLKKIVLPGFDVRLMPYCDQRFTVCDANLRAYKTPPRVIFTGDSRTWNGIDPEVLARMLHVRPDRFFNFGTSSQVVSFAREVFVPHLLETGIHPQYLVIGVTPDWLLARENFMGLNVLYRESLAFQLTHPGTGHRDRIDTAVSHFLARNLALYRYRGDLLYQEIVPDLKCWLTGRCSVTANGTRMNYRLEALLASAQTRYGWGPQAWDGMLSGEYDGPPRFTEQDPVDQANLVGLIGDVRRVGITPLFLRMPVHPSFQRVHEPAMSRDFAILAAVAKREGVAVIEPPGDYDNPKLFVDGHHLSRHGAAYYSANLAPALLPYVRPERASRNRADRL